MSSVQHTQRLLFNMSDNLKFMVLLKAQVVQFILQTL